MWSEFRTPPTCWSSSYVPAISDGVFSTLCVCVCVCVCERERENSNSNSKTLFSKDCSLGSFRPV